LFGGFAFAQKNAILRAFFEDVGESFDQIEEKSMPVLGHHR
jgi:hypothetical protein